MSNWKKKFTHLFMIIKPDGRIRPLGSYSDTVCKILFSYASNGLNRILTVTTHLKHFMLFKTRTLKAKIAIFNQIAMENDLEITNKTFDVKNFYMEINQKTLIEKLRFVLNLYRQQFHTNCISFPKTDKKLPTICGPTTDSKYVTFTLEKLEQILIFAISNAYFTIDIHIVRQILGLPMG